MNSLVSLNSGSVDIGGITAEEVIKGRSGSVLIKDTLLKADHFPGCQNTKLRPLIDGVPNFRQIEGLPVYGVAIPTVSGLRNVLDVLGAQGGLRKVYWHNMREEPVIYINGQPYVVREADQPFCNLEYTGIDRSRVEEMEVRLKADILREAQQFGGQILVSQEDDDMQVLEMWEPVTEADVQTPLEVYAELQADGYDVDYTRIPVTDEKAPKEGDFELLVRRIHEVPEGAALMFNCQMGRGRTTTGMIIAALVYLRRARAFPGDPLWDPSAAPAWFRSINTAPSTPRAADAFKAGHWGVVRSLLRVLELGQLGKAILDAVVDAAATMQNLREAIAGYRGRILSESKEHKRAAVTVVCLQYLERYYMLIAFATYLASPKFAPGSPGHAPFPDWMQSRPELRSILFRMLKRNALAALELYHPGATLPVGHPQTPQTDLEQDDADVRRRAEDQASAIVAMRAGQVLGQHTILKEDVFPTMQSKRLQQGTLGAPNYRFIRGFSVFGVGMSTVQGIKEVLTRVCSSSSSNGAARSVLWFNIREEPVLYINGRPFVLREEQRPLKNLQEYQGIDRKRLENMEARLREDVLREAAAYGGRILVARECCEDGLYSELCDAWEDIGDANCVQTPAQVYQRLQQEGHSVHYCRVPVTDGTAPSPATMDIIVEHMLQHGLAMPVVFNCQMGGGRTTTGMVMACLLQLAGASQLNRISSKITLQDLLPVEQSLAGNSDDEDCFGGDSPRSDGGSDSARTPNGKPWDVSEEEAEEQRSLAAGGYMGVRRVVRLLENGEGTKRAVDAVVDACAQVINLRAAIMRYRKPRSSYNHLRPEVNQRHAAFSRGSAYLERYCLLIAFAAYLEQNGAHASLPFSRWLASRSDLKAALAAIHSNPAAALAPVPVYTLPLVVHEYQPADGQGGAVSAEEQERVLSRRRGKLLARRTILKSYKCKDPVPGGADGSAAADGLAHGPGLAAGARQARGLPIFTVGNASVEQLARLLAQLGAGPGGSAHVVVSDVREELVVYVNGTPYMRRELEMPAAALHHAGIHSRQLEEQEQLLKDDVLADAARWGGKILLHRELPPELALKASSSRRSMQLSSSPAMDDVTALADTNPLAAVAPFWEPVADCAAFSSSSSSNTVAGALVPALEQLHVSRTLSFGSSLPAAAGMELAQHSVGAAEVSDSLTVANGSADGGAPADAAAAALAARASPFAAAATNGSAAASAAQLPPSSTAPNGTCGASPAGGLAASANGSWASLHSSVQAAGPAGSGCSSGTAATSLSLGPAPPGRPGSKSLATAREVFSQLRALGLQLSYRRIPLSRERTPQAGDVQDLYRQMIVTPMDPNRHVVHVIASRTATGSSSRFAAAALAVHLIRGSASAPPAGPSVRSPSRSSSMRRSSSDLGEYRAIMSLSRLLPQGWDIKQQVDAAIVACSQVGNLVEDIRSCKHTFDLAPAATCANLQSAAWAARRLGLHYLKRYFLLICFRSFLDQRSSATASFTEWMAKRPELQHMLQHISLDA